MQKSKKATIGIIIFIFLYGLLADFKLINNINKLYLYIINPIFWIVIAIFLRFALGRIYEKQKIKKEIIQYSLIAVLTYVIVYLISGLFISFGKNPYFTTFKGFILNIWMFGTVIFAKEYIRYRLINNTFDKYKVKIAVLISIVYILIEIRISKYIGLFNFSMVFIIKEFAQKLMPLIAKNILYSYISINTTCAPAICYGFLTSLFFWISPILPNSPWVMVAIIDTVIPVILWLYIRYEKNKRNALKSKQDVESTDPRNIIPLVILIVLAIWFAIGIFPIKPVAIATGSMEKELMVGDIAIIKKCKANDIIEGDVIEYQMEGYTVIHRVVSKKQTNGEYSFITKGDNNAKEDVKPVTEDQLIGKAIFKVKYLGYPAIWLHLIQVNEQVEVETGK